MDLSSLVDRIVPGPDTAFDRVSAASHGLVTRVAETPAGRPAFAALHGNRWNGHPLHPVVITLPIGAWCVSAWADARAARTGAAADEHAADLALRVGVAGAVVAASTGVAQYLDTRGQVRRETTLHASLNTVALTLYAASWVARKNGRRGLGRKLSTVALGVVGVSGYLGGDISYRHGVGVRPQVLHQPYAEAHDSSDTPVEASGAGHS